MFGKKKKKPETVNDVPPLTQDFVRAVAPRNAPITEVLESARDKGQSGREAAYPFPPLTARGLDYMVEMRVREWALRNRPDQNGHRQPPQP